VNREDYAVPSKPSGENLYQPIFHSAGTASSNGPSMIENRQKPKVDISSTGGSNSRFLSKLRLKKGLSRNNGVF
jgi:hypothetical protein